MSDEPSGFLTALREGARPVALPPGALPGPQGGAGADPARAIVARIDIAPDGPARFEIGLKDIFALPGHVPGGGTRLPIDRPQEPGAIARRLAAGGGRVVAALHLDELAAGGSGGNRHHGRCLNPWNPDHLTGGSSGGSAAAVAAGTVAVALGSDAGGSTRIPAAWCGVTGHKPTYGLVPRSGALARGWSVDCIGPLARDAGACAALLALLAGQDAADPVTWRQPALDRPAPARLRIALPALPEGAADPATRAALDAAAGTFRALGHDVSPGPAADFDAINALHQTLVRAEAATLHAALIEAHPDLCDPGVAALILSGRSIPVTAHLAALAGRARVLRAFLARHLAGADLLLLPVAPTPAPRFEGAAAAAARMTDDARLTRLANHLGLPATAFPAGFCPGGLPVGLQLVGAPFADGLCLGAVAQFQSATEHHLARPPLWCGG